jgi:hypothetical protein
MKFAFAIVLFAAGSVAAQVTVLSGKQTEIPVPAATAAVSMDTHVADVSLNHGILIVRGVDPGDTVVMEFKENDLEQIPVHVVAGRPIYPPGFTPPPAPENATASYEARYNTEENQIENTLDLTHQTGEKTTALHITSDVFGSGPRRTAVLPSAYYRITTPQSDFTLLDQNVNESPLTLQNVIVRGLHIRDDGWRFHAGYTGSADFADVLIPTEKEFAAGLDRTLKWSDSLNVTPGVYFFRSIDLATGEQRSAGISSLLLGLNLAPTWQMKAEVAYGHNFAYAGELHHEGDTTKIIAHVMDRKIDFPTLRSSSLPGLSADMLWTKIFSSKLSFMSDASVYNVVLSNIQQNTESVYANLNYKFSPSWSVGSGISYGLFRNVGLYSERTFTLPEEINFNRPSYGLGLQYQSSAASDGFSRGAGIRQTARLNWRRFQFGELVAWQKDALSVSTLFSQIPGLQAELQHLGITAVTPEELTALLQDAAFLELLGLSGSAQVITIPERIQQGGSLSWISASVHPRQLSVSVMTSHNDFGTSHTNEYDLTGTYSQQIKLRNHVQISWSMVKSNLGGQEAFTPLISGSFRRTFSRAPAFALHKSTGIGGTVFVDGQRKGYYQAGMQIIPGVTVVLDGQTKAVTDAQGHFRFGGLDGGSHRIQLRFHSDHEYYFTSPEEVQVGGGSVVNFGVAFPKTDLWGYVKDDAGYGMEHVKLRVTGTVQTVISTDTAGKFILPDARPGDYRFEVVPDSVALGYSAEDVPPVDATMSERANPHLIFSIPAVRILIGTVTIYDPGVGRYVPVRNAEVNLPEIGRKARTNADGRFTLSALPAGDYRINVAAGAAFYSTAISVSVQPVTLRRDFRISSLTGEITSSAVSIFP